MRTKMPVGAYEKSQVRAIAEELGLYVAHKPDSMEICFVPDQDYARFIEENSGKKIPEGNFVTTDGKIVGRHRGITHYTVGQRKGLNLSMESRCLCWRSGRRQMRLSSETGRRSMQTG